MTPTPLDSDLWNILHDGTLESISGIVPGELRLGISIEYLREGFEDPGKLIFITLHRCTKFAYESTTALGPLDDRRLIAALDIEILGSNQPGEVTCFDRVAVSGRLSMAAEGYSLTLDSGRSIGMEDLLHVAGIYWERFEKRALAR